MQWLAWNYPEVAEDTFAIPNEGKTSWHRGRQMKLAGMKAGTPDLMVPVAMHGFNGLFIETKTKTGRLSKAQKYRHERLKARNYKVETCHSIEEFKKIVEDYLN